MTNSIAPQSWASSEFADARLGDRRLHARLVAMAAQIAEAPAGTVTEVFPESADREGAYRFVENDAIDPIEIGRAALRSCLQRAAGFPFFFVPVDESSITLTDRGQEHGLGRVGTTKCCARGLEVISAIGVAPDGTPIGYAGQHYWARVGGLTKKYRKKRTIEQKETRHWLTTIGRVETERREVEGSARPWYQLDRGGDFKELIEWAADTDAWLTVRANANRVVRDAEARHLWSAMDVAPLLGSYDFEVSKSHGREAREAHIEVRAKKVELQIHVPKKRTKRGKYRARGERLRFIEMWAVLAREVGTVPRDEEPIEWLLLTNRPVKSLSMAKLVIRGYSYRWRIEDFHRTWKTTCRVEDAQLRSAGAVERWAVTLAVVAMRIQRLMYLARTQPELPATEELTRDEIDALLLHKQPKKFNTDFMPTIGEAVTWIAEMGGYTGKSSGGPPGAQTTGRGLQRLLMAARTVAAMRRVRSDQ